MKFPNIGNVYLNWGGLKEKWFIVGSIWYFLMPDGTLYKWDGKAKNADMMLGGPIATFPPDFYTSHSKMYEWERLCANLI